MILESISVSFIPCGETSFHNSQHFILQGNNADELNNIQGAVNVCSRGSRIILRVNDCGENDDAGVYCGTIALYLRGILCSHNGNENGAGSSVGTAVGPCNLVLLPHENSFSD